MKKSVMPGLIFIFLALTVLSCKTMTVATKQPDWVRSESSKYPNKKFLVGVGTGDTRKAAEELAYAAISRIFLAEIQHRTRRLVKFFRTDEKNKSTWRKNMEVDELTKVSTHNVLENVSIAEIYLDREKQTYFALAVMDRQKAELSLRQRISALDQELEELLKAARASDHKIQKVRLLHKAVGKMFLRDTYNTQLRVVSLTGTGKESPTAISKIQEELQDFLSRNFRILLVVTGPESERIRTAIVEGLSSHGLTVSYKDTPNADVVIDGSIDFVPVEMPQAKFVKWEASFELQDLSTGQIIGSVIRRGREGHIDETRAEARALKAAQNELSKDISNRLVRYIFGKKPES